MLSPTRWFPLPELLTGERRADYLQSSVPQLSNSKATATQSIVFHATNWLRLFGSRSENFAATSAPTAFSVPSPRRTASPRRSDSV